MNSRDTIVVPKVGCVFVFLLQERELLSRISELQEEVTRRKNHIANLDHEIHTLNENISTLTKELELKGKEVLKIRSEANQQIRCVCVFSQKQFIEAKVFFLVIGVKARVRFSRSVALISSINSYVNERSR